MKSVEFNRKGSPIIELYKNRKERIGIINPEWIDGNVIKYKHKDISEFGLSIPNKVGNQPNKIYNRILTNQQILIGDERFIVMKPKGRANKHSSDKQFTCYSFQKTLDSKRVEIEGSNYQLVSNDVDISEGILEKAIKGTEWTIGAIDEDAMKETTLAPDIQSVDVVKSYTKENVQYDDLLWEKDFNIDISNEYPTMLTINYKNLNRVDNMIRGLDIVNRLEPLYTGVRHVKCYYYNDSDNGNRWSTKYEITLADGVIETVYSQFTNVTNADINIDDIYVSYETGTFSEQRILRFPYFDTIDDSVYKLLQSIEESFDCTMDYNTKDKIINVIANANVGKASRPLLSFKTNVLEVTKTETEEIISALKVIGKDNLDFSEVNIFGGNTIYNYDFYVKNHMSEECKSHWNRYIALINSRQQEFETLKLNMSLTYNKIIKYESEIKSLEKQIKYKKDLLSDFLDGHDKVEQEKLQRELKELESKFNDCMAEYNALNKRYDEYKDDMKIISDSINRKTASDSQGIIFTEDDLQELDDYTFVRSINDDYYTTPKSLYNNYVKVLDESVIPKIEWTMETDSLMSYLKNSKNGITEGDLFTVDEDLENNIGQETIRLVGFEWNVVDNSIENVEFTNKDKKNEVLSKSSNSSRRSTNASNKVNSWNGIMNDSIISNNFVDSVMREGLDASATMVRNRIGSNRFELGSAGFYILHGDDGDNKQMYLGNGLFSITEDGWKTSKVSIDTHGIIAQNVYGKLIAGQELIICTTDETGEVSNSFYIGNIKNREPNRDGSNFGLRIADKDNKERIFIGLEKDPITGYKMAKFRLTSADGQDVVIDENGIIQCNQFNQSESFDYEHPMIIPFRSMEGTTAYKKVTLTLTFEKYRAYERSASSGGQSTTSQSSSTTTTSVDGHRHMMYKYSGADKWVETNNNTLHPDTWRGFIFDYAHSGNVGTIGNAGLGHMRPVFCCTANAQVMEVEDMYTYSSSSAHSHNFPHTHGVSSHTHNLIYGIYEDTTPSNCAVYVNNQLVSASLFDSCELDITRYIKTNQMNEIKITSATRGRITANIASKFWQQW